MCPRRWFLLFMITILGFCSVSCSRCSASGSGSLVEIPTENLIELSKITDEQDQLLRQLESKLSKQETKLKEQERSLESSSTKLKTVEKSLIDSKQIIAEQERSLKELSDKIKKERHDRTTRGILIGVIVGFLVGINL